MSRSVITRSIRFEPQDAFMIELAARVHRRNFSSFVNVAAIEAATNCSFRDGSTIGDQFHALWDEERDVRLQRLYRFDKTLLTYDEMLYVRSLSKKKKKS